MLQIQRHFALMLQDNGLRQIEADNTPSTPSTPTHFG